jgi:[ribosomal protein S5]-alanine N-acetyltransferase
MDDPSQAGRLGESTAIGVGGDARRPARPLLVRSQSNRDGGRLPTFPLATRRLSLRPPQLGDCNDLGRLLGDSTACAAGCAAPPTPDEMRRRIVAAQRAIEQRTGLALVLIARDSGKLIGWFECGYGRHRGDVALISFWLGADHRGAGFATEAGRAAVPAAIAFLDAKILWADLQPDNLAAARVVRRLGLMPIGRPGSRSGSRRSPASFCKDLAGIV